MANTRHQNGQIIERSGTFYVRFYDTEGKRAIRKLCVADKEHTFRKRGKRYKFSDAVKLIRDKVMGEVNAEAGATPRTNGRNWTVPDFWDEKYEPWVKENLRPSTHRGYTKLWNIYLQDHFKDRTLREYRTHEGSEFLTSLVKPLTRNTLSHVRSLASGIFTHALNLGLIENNPWRDVKVLAKVRAANPTQHYTLEEAENTISALVSRVDAQAVFALAFFLGLRPSEIAGLQWGDVDEHFTHIRRGAVRGVVGTTKTQRSQRTITLIQPVKGLLKLWRAKCGNVTVGWVFPNQKNGPLNVESFVRNVMLPLIADEGLKWKGLYAARRGCATMLVNLTGDVRAGFQVLGNSYAVLEKNYLKTSLEQGEKGMRLLEEAAQQKSLSK
ncbi:hypothetical protein SBA1_550121 [Candidatus Sulfotelmatobacter kueseliae]|uniref:Tyr recombinase domain-containing protein n=1 Tax=Candidatus Sulfotelmatobacter kueseliae TaxID=2042962 RepID=A0A2U3KYJ7_9BACT|nr:hypothetical protein SBA1_550121 [Candidatus Sulfotelmatobacter kueseliae]